MNAYVKKSLYSLQNLIKIKSVEGEKTNAFPFGEGPANCLNAFLSIASEMGFETVNYDNYIGEVIFGSGNDKDGLAI